MKVQLLFLSLFLCKFVLTSYAQQSEMFQCTSGKPYASLSGDKNIFIVDEYAYLIKTNERDVSIQKFDISKMEELQRKEHKDFLPKKSNELGKKGLQTIIKMHDGKIYYIYSEFYNGPDLFELKAQEIDKNKCTFFPEKILLVEPIEMVDQQPYSFSDRLFLIRQSSDFSKLLVSYKVRSNLEDNPDSYYKLVHSTFASDLHLIATDEFTMPRSKKNIQLINADLMNNGHVTVLGINNDKNTLEYVSYTTDSLIANTLPIAGDRRMANISIMENESGNIVLFALYMDNEGDKHAYKYGFIANGFFYAELSITGELISEKNYEFSDEFLNQHGTELQRAKAGNRRKIECGGFLWMRMTYFAKDPEGGFVVVGECNFPCKHDLSFDYDCSSNAIILRLDEKGEMLWKQHISKEQKSRKSYEKLGVKYLRGPDAHYLMFLDNANNLYLTENQPARLHMVDDLGMLTGAIVYESDGSIEKSAILDLQQTQNKSLTNIQPRDLKRVTNSMFISEVKTKGKLNSMVKIELVN